MTATNTKTSAVECRRLLTRVSRYRRLPALFASLALVALLAVVGGAPAVADEPLPSPTPSIPSETIAPSPSVPSSPEPSDFPTGGESAGSSVEPSPSATPPDGWTRDDIDAVLTGVVCVAFMASLGTLAALGR